MIASVHRGTKIAPDSPGCRELGPPIFHQPFGMDQGLNRGLGVPGSFWASMLSMSVMGFPAVDTLASAVRGGGHEGKGGGGRQATMLSRNLPNRRL